MANHLLLLLLFFSEAREQHCLNAKILGTHFCPSWADLFNNNYYRLFLMTYKVQSISLNDGIEAECVLLNREV